MALLVTRTMKLLKEFTMLRDFLKISIFIGAELMGQCALLPTAQIRLLSTVRQLWKGITIWLSLMERLPGMMRLMIGRIKSLEKKIKNSTRLRFSNLEISNIPFLKNIRLTDSFPLFGVTGVKPVTFILFKNYFVFFECKKPWINYESRAYKL